MKFRGNDVVELVDDIPADSLSKGTIGVVVMGFVEPEEAYEVEFCNENGETIAQIALRPYQIELA